MRTKMVLFSLSALAIFFYFHWISEMVFIFVYAYCRHNGLVFSLFWLAIPCAVFFCEYRDGILFIIISISTFLYKRMLNRSPFINIFNFLHND